MGKKALITGTIALTITGFITRMLGFVFRIYMSNIMGAEGLGLYQLIFPIYMLIWSASSAGISIAVSRKVAEYTVKGRHADASRTLKAAILIAVSISLVLSGLIYLFATPIATYYVHSPNTALGLRYLCICVPFMATACCIRGYFQGRQEMGVSGTAQVIEQLARMIVIYVFAGFYIPHGLMYACALGTLGLCFGEAASCLYTFIVFRLKQRKLPPSTPTIRYGSLISTLVTISLPITANRFLASGLVSIENILIPIQLEKFGLTPTEAIGMYGMFSGMAMPLLFFPSMVTNSISVALVPAISEAVAAKNTRYLHLTVSKAIHFSSLIGIGAAGLFLTLGEEIAIMCYGVRHIQVGEMLRLLAIVCPFLYLQGILTGMLNGLGLQKLTFKGNIMASIISIVAILIFVPRQGIIGFIFALLLHSGFVTIYHMFHILEHVSLEIDLMGWIVKPALAALCGCLFVGYLHSNLLLTFLSPTFATLGAIGILVLFYMAFLFVFRSLTLQDIRQFIR